MKRIITNHLSPDLAKEKGIFEWPIWEKEVSVFNWEYDSDEHCYIIEGEVDIETSEGKYTLSVGDYVVFKRGLQCVWKIKKAIKKHYYFPEN